MKKVLFIFLFFAMTVILIGCNQAQNITDQKPLREPVADKDVKSVSEAEKIQPDEPNQGQLVEEQDAKEKLCGWIDQSDIIVKVNFADGVVKDTSYETGFYFSQVNSSMRLARAGCDYRTGFKFSEFKNKGAAEVGVRGYSDSRRRQLLGGAVPVVFDENGVPNIGKNIEVTITD
jgi:hypothetical protein